MVEIQTALIKRFRDYLAKELKALPDTKDANDFRSELLDNLSSHALDLKEKGDMTDDEIYNVCIESLGDYSATLRELCKNPIDVIKDARFWRNALYAVLFSLFAVIVYVAVSFTTHKWGLTAVIIFPALLVSLFMALAVISLRRNTQLKKHYTTDFFIFCLEALVITALYFILAFAVKADGWFSAGRAWSIFSLLFPAAIVAVIFSNVVFRKKKTPMNTYAWLVIVSSVSVYLLVATIIQAYHPYWLIILAGVFVGVFLMTLEINKKIKKQK